MKSLALRIVLAWFVVAGIAASVIACSSSTVVTVPPSRSVASQIATDAVPTSVRAIGTMGSANQASLAFQSSGRVKEINVKEGDKVKAGTQLASLDTSILDLQVAQAQAALDTAQAKFDQLKNPSQTDVAAAQANVASAEAALLQLKSPSQNDVKIAKADLDSAQAALSSAQSAYDRIGGDSNPFGGMSPQGLALQQASNNYQKALAAFNARTNPTDAQVKQAQSVLDQARAQLARVTSPSANDLKAAQAAVDQAKASVDLAKQNIANAKIVAPFDGTVLWITPHIGESVTPATSAITFADLSKMQVIVGIDETMLGRIRIGQTATITSDSLMSKILTGHVSKIGLLATNTAGIINVPVTIDIDATDVVIAPGLSATAEIQMSK